MKCAVARASDRNKIVDEAFVCDTVRYEAVYLCALKS